MFDIDKEPRYSIRKLTIGVASVLVGFVIFGLPSTQVQADTVNSSTPAQTEEIQSNKQVENNVQQNETPKVDTQGEDRQESAPPTAEVQKTQPVETETEKPVVTDQTKSVENKSSDATKVTDPVIQNKTNEQVQENKSTDTEAQQTNKQVEAPVQSVPSQKSEIKQEPKQTSTIDVTKASKEKNNTSGLTASWARDAGDIDHVNIDDWNYSNLSDGNVEVRTKKGITYVGDVVIPNTADLVSAGKITDPNGKAYIRNGTLQVITNSPGVTSITISKNDNSKLYVKDNILAYAFSNQYGRNNDIKKLDVGALDISNVTNLDQTFELNPNLTEIDGLDKWDVSHVTTMRDTFYGDPKLTSEALAGISNWNTRNLEILYATFEQDPGITNLDFLKNWDTSKVNIIYAAFTNDQNLTDINGLANWNTENLQDIGSAFIGTAITNLNALKNWNTSNLVSMFATFWADFNLSDISGIANWDVSKVKWFESAFLYDYKIKGLVNLNNWKISADADTKYMFYPGGREATPLMVIVKSGAENINNGTTPFGAGSTRHYLYKVENNGQIIQTLPAKAFNSASDAVKEINDNLATIGKTLSRKGYTFDGWQGEYPYGKTGAYELYVAKWIDNNPKQPTQPTNKPGKSDVPTIPDTPVQPTDAPNPPAQPTTPVQPTNGPVLPEDTPDANKPEVNDDSQTVKPHAEKVTKAKKTGRRVAPTAVQNAKGSRAKPAPTTLNRESSGKHVVENTSNKPVAEKKAKDTLPQTGEKSDDDLADVGLLGLTSLGLLGLAEDRKRKS